jgi:hypothetical protein
MGGDPVRLAVLSYISGLKRKRAWLGRCFHVAAFVLVLLVALLQATENCMNVILHSKQVMGETGLYL